MLPAARFAVAAPAGLVPMPLEELLQHANEDALRLLAKKLQVHAGGVAAGFATVLHA